MHNWKKIKLNNGWSEPRRKNSRWRTLKRKEGEKKMSSRKAEREENQQSVNKGKLGKVAVVAQVYTRLVRFPWDVHVNHFKHF